MERHGKKQWYGKKKIKRHRQKKRKINEIETKRDGKGKTNKKNDFENERIIHKEME